MSRHTGRVPSPQAATRPRRKPDEVKALLRAAAVAELEEVGAERASLRSIARRVGISHQAVTYHYADKAALFTSVAVEAFDALKQQGERMLAAVPEDAPAGTAVATLGESYVLFARAKPAQFGLMYLAGLAEPASPELHEAHMRMWGLFLSTTSAAIERGWAESADPELLALTCWSMAHGLAMLEAKFPGEFPVRGQVEHVLYLIASSVIR